MVSTVSTGVIAQFDAPFDCTRGMKEWADTKWREAVFTPEQVVAASAPQLCLGTGCDEPGVYFLLRAGRIAYVGMAKGLSGRINQHRVDGRPFDAVAVIAGLPRLWVREFESAYIDAWNPRWNMCGGDGYAEWLPEMTAMLSVMPKDLIERESEWPRMTSAEIEAIADKLG